jgi:hypothetical protein
MRSLIIATCIAMASLGARTATAQGKADDPSVVLAHSAHDLAACVSSKKPVKVTLTLVLDGDSHVKSVQIDASSKLGKKSRACLEATASRLTFSPTLAWQTLEHTLTVVNSGNRPR